VLLDRTVVEPMRGLWMWSRRTEMVMAAILFVLLAGCAADRRASFVPAGRGELLASDKLWGERWSIYCAVDPSVDSTTGFGPAPRGACAKGGADHPCVQVDYVSGMVVCQLEDLPERLTVAHSLQGPDEDRLLFFGVVDATVARVEFKLKKGPNLAVHLINPVMSRFKLFVTGLTRKQGRLLERPLLWDELGNLMSRKAS
jgi:hypothetical protein